MFCQDISYCLQIGYLEPYQLRIYLQKLPKDVFTAHVEDLIGVVKRLDLLPKYAFANREITMSLVRKHLSESAARKIEQRTDIFATIPLPKTAQDHEEYHSWSVLLMGEIGNTLYNRPRLLSLLIHYPPTGEPQQDEALVFEQYSYLRPARLQLYFEELLRFPIKSVDELARIKKELTFLLRAHNRGVINLQLGSYLDLQYVGEPAIAKIVLAFCDLTGIDEGLLVVRQEIPEIDGFVEFPDEDFEQDVASIDSDDSFYGPQIPPSYDLVTRFLNDPIAGKTRIQHELELPALPERMWMELSGAVLDEPHVTVGDDKIERFISIYSRLPPELQMTLCVIYGGEGTDPDLLRHKHIQTAFDWQRRGALSDI